jgi:hypothetical protein
MRDKRVFQDHPCRSSRRRPILDSIFQVKQPQLKSETASLYYQCFSLSKTGISTLFWTAMTGIG